MIFHISMGADNPEATAKFFASLWGGQAYAFPPGPSGSWMALAGDARNSMVEVYPRGTEMRHGGDAASKVQMSLGPLVREQPNHAAMATPLQTEAVLDLAKSAGYPTRLCDRGPFPLIEVWIDGCQLIEVLTPEMQNSYLNAMTMENWEAISAKMTEAAAAAAST